MKKEPNIGTVPCLVCGNEFKYLTTSHCRTHAPGKPQTIPEYRRWVGEQFDIDPDDPILADDTLLKPQRWRAKRERFEGWRDRIPHSKTGSNE